MFQQLEKIYSDGAGGCGIQNYNQCDDNKRFFDKLLDKMYFISKHVLTEYEAARWL